MRADWHGSSRIEYADGPIGCTVVGAHENAPCVGSRLPSMLLFFPPQPSGSPIRLTDAAPAYCVGVVSATSLVASSALLTTYTSRREVAGSISVQLFTSSPLGTVVTALQNLLPGRSLSSASA